MFIDESGLLMAPLVRRSWSPCGCTPILRQRTRFHRKISIIGALCVTPERDAVQLFFRLHAANINAALVVQFLRQLDRQLAAPAILIWDRLQAHRACKVKDFIAEHPHLRTEFLPAYAPELNPIEYFWGYLKFNPLANLACLDLDRLADSTRNAARSVQRNHSLLYSFILHTPLSLRLK